MNTTTTILLALVFIEIIGIAAASCAAFYLYGTNTALRKFIVFTQREKKHLCRELVVWQNKAVSGLARHRPVLTAERSDRHETDKATTRVVGAQEAIAREKTRAAQNPTIHATRVPSAPRNAFLTDAAKVVENQ